MGAVHLLVPYIDNILSTVVTQSRLVPWSCSLLLGHVHVLRPSRSVDEHR